MALRSEFVLFRVARDGWYMWCQQRTRISTRQHCDSVVLKAFTRSKHRSSLQTDERCVQSYHFNVKTVASSLRRQGLRAKTDRKFNPVIYRAHNLLPERDFYATGLNQKWAGTSLTYVHMKTGCIW